MIVVNITKEAYSIWQTSIDKDLKEMKHWCRTTFGKGRSNGVWLWKSQVRYNVCHRSYFIRFFFTEESHATWFNLKWGST